MGQTPTRIWNPPNPYLAESRELLGEPPPIELEVYEDSSQSILSRNDSPDLSFRWSVNPYRGCFHACGYCYARPTHEYLGLGAGTDFERKIFVKKNAPALLEQAFHRQSWVGERIVFSGVTDCYQPLEAAWKLTRGCLEVCLDFRNPAAVITKSSLVRRDIDLLRELARAASVSVAVSIPFLDEEVARAIEPGAPAIRKRFETLALLSQAGIPAGIGVAPIIPGLNDRDIPGLLRQARRCGAKFAFRTLLRLPGSVREVFFHRLREKLPLKAGHIESLIRGVRGGGLTDSRFGFRHEGSGPYWETIDRSWELWASRFGFDEALPERPNRFRRPPAGSSQLEFQWQEI